MKSTPDSVPIGDAANWFGVATHALRHWESMGLLTPTRVSGQRRYGDVEFHRIATVLRAKQAGFGLDQIAAMINTKDARHRRGILRRHQDELRRSIEAAERGLQMISCAIACDHHDFTQCEHYRRAIGDGTAH